MKYWEDIDLFKRIIRLAVDKEPKVQLENSGDFSDFTYKKGTYNKVLFFTYGLLQTIGIVLTTFFVMWGFETKDWKTSVLGSIGLIGTVYLLRKFVKLSVWWRQVLKSKNTSEQNDKYKLENSAVVVRFLMHSIGWVLVILDLTYIPARFWFAEVSTSDIWHYIGYFRDLLIISFVGIVLHYLLYTKKRSGDHPRSTWDSPELRTFVLSIIVLVAGYFISVYQSPPLLVNFIPYESFYNNFLTTLLITTSITWFFTLSCHRIARKTAVLRKK